MTVRRVPAPGRLAIAMLAAVASSVGLAVPALAGQPVPSTTVQAPVTTTTAAPGPTTTTTTVRPPPPTTTVPGTPTTAAPPTTAATVPPTTTPATVPGPTTTLVNPAQLAALVKGLNVDLARMSAIQAFQQATAALTAGPPVPPASLLGPGMAPPVAVAPAPDPQLVIAAAAEVRSVAATHTAEGNVASSKRGLHELAVAYYVHADVQVKSVPVDPTTGTAEDRSVILAMLLGQERHSYDSDRQILTAAVKTQAQAKSRADQLVAARVAAIEAYAKAATPPSTVPVSTPVGAPGATTTTTVPAATSRAIPGYGASGLSILGPPALSAGELAAWFASTGHLPSLTVPLPTLTALYQSNGALYGVRDDIAFAQAIIETGYFGFPSGGQDTTAMNNFAGIGACDSCTAGSGFADATTGVAAQLQLLHNYASAAPLPGPLGLAVGPTGCCPTWMSLTGVWATASYYGFAILTLYKAMVEWVLPRRSTSAGL